MRKRDLDEIRKKLMVERERILSNAVKTMDNITNPNLDDLNDEGDVASSEASQTLNLRLRDREAMLLAKVDKTLKKIDEGLYGICESCGAEIHPQRLKARPVATLCIRCKQEQEKNEKGFAD